MVEQHAILVPDHRATRDPEELGRALGVAGNTIRKAVREGAIRGIQLTERRIVIPLPEVRRLLGVESGAECLVPAGEAVESL